MVLASAYGTLSDICAMVVWWDVLNVMRGSWVVQLRSREREVSLSSRSYLGDMQ